MNQKELIKVSKYLSYILRHKPEKIGIELNEYGWANIDELIKNTSEFNLTFDIINVVVETNDKQRFGLNKNKTQIKANQGHSVEVDLNLKPKTPPTTLYHGSATRYLKSIKKQGINKQGRHHVHLSELIVVAKNVGSRHGKPVILFINTTDMIEDGYKFYKSENGVWLVKCVPTKYIYLITGE